MATWNQGGIAGSLLGGIGGVNSNAPRATDANTALSLIRENNDIQRSGANNPVLQGLQGLYGVAQMYQADQQAQRQSDFLQKYGAARADGDVSSMRQLFAEFPEMNEQIGKGMEGISADTRESLGNVAANFRMAVNAGTGDQFVAKNAAELMRLGIDPKEAQRLAKADPKGAVELADTIGMSALTPEKYFDVIGDKENRKVTMRGQDITAEGNRLSAETTRRGQDISAATARRGQDISASTTRRGQDMAMRRSMSSGGGEGERTVQLSDGRTVGIVGKVHGAGANAYYEGIDNNGNTVRVPANSIAAPASSSASATNYAMKKDIDAILNADPEQLDFMTGVSGGVGAPAVGADYRSRWNGKEQRQFYTAAQRVQGRMQNQGIAAARDMGASGINTVAEAKMYFQGMPQMDYSSPDAMKQSLMEIQEYTNNYNQQYNADVGGSKPSSKQQPAQQQSGYSSLWGD
ncbi:phage DNA ejection protein [Morganella morganii]|uniref:phage DNA ejection protein n=1 Tax=Morganella morganii TaxID=582 RepID=UPI000B404753|nr:phage DNA ejection protein [Morganella morganii]MBT0306056.1 phage DNA ejection protein [Morganella morganii subsp. morganii]OVF55366.1 DNA transfer protein [Morganella morganii]